MKTINTLMLILGGISLSLILAKPACAQSSGKPVVVTKEKHQVHVKIDDDKDGKITKLDTAFEVGPDFDLNAWMKSRGIELPELPEPPEAPQSQREVMIMKLQDCKDLPPELMTMPMGDGDVMIKEFNQGMAPPCDPMDKDCMIKWLESDSIKLMIDNLEPMDFRVTKDLEMVNDDDKSGKHTVTKIVFSKVIVKKVDGKTYGKGAKALEAEIYPNPSTGVFTIDVAIPGKKTASLLITDKAGNVLYAEEVESSGKREVDLSAQGKGIYFLKLKQGGTSLQRKIMVN